MMKEVKVYGEVVDPKGDSEEDKEYEDWELQCKANTLVEAEELKADPELMKALKPYLEKKAKAYTSIAALREEGAKQALAKAKVQK